MLQAIWRMVTVMRKFSTRRVILRGRKKFGFSPLNRRPSVCKSRGGTKVMTPYDGGGGSSTAPTHRAAVRPRTVRDLSRKNTPGLKKAASIPAAVSSGRSSSPAVIDAPAPSPSYHAPTGDETLSASVVDPLAAALAAQPSPMPSPKAALQSVTPVSADVPAGRTIGPDVAMTDDPFDIPLLDSTSASSASAPPVTAAAAVGPVHTRWTEPVSPAHGSLALEPDSPPDSPVHSWCAVLGVPSFSVPWPDLWQGAAPHICDPTPRPRTAHSYRPTYRPTHPPR